MAVSRCCRKLAAATLLAFAPALAEPGATQVELTTLAESGNLLHGAPASAPPPWETLGSVRSGRESLARLQLARSDAGFATGVDTTALLRFDLDLNRTALRDASSFAQVTWRPGAAALWLRAYPFDTDYWRLGWLHALDWGGTRGSSGQSSFLSRVDGAPGAQIGWQTPRATLRGGVKWTQTEGVVARRWGGLLQGSLELARPLRVEAGLGYFQRPERGFVEGASVRLVWHRGAAAPELAPEPFRPPLLEDARHSASLLSARAVSRSRSRRRCW